MKIQNLIFVFSFILLLSLSTVLATTIKVGESVTLFGKEIKVVAIQESKVVLSVGTEKNIISLGQTRVINNLEITLLDISNFDEFSTVSFDAKTTFICGDNICSEGENSETCCQDCDCPYNYQCTSSGCLIPECFLNEDCNDNNALTDDSCKEYKCQYREKNCKTNSDCNDNNVDTDDYCYKGQCQNLQNWVCKTDTDCKSDNPCVLAQCINKDCQYKKIDNCNPPEKKEEKKEVEPLKFVDEEHPGFFKRVLNWFKGLF